MKDRKALNKHDYYGSWSPEYGKYTGQKTFSLGIFRWVAKASGAGLKKSAVVHRVKGVVGDYLEIHRIAQSICDKLDAGHVPKTKTTTIRSGK